MYNFLPVEMPRHLFFQFYLNSEEVISGFIFRTLKLSCSWFVRKPVGYATDFDIRLIFMEPVNLEQCNSICSIPNLKTKSTRRHYET